MPGPSTRAVRTLLPDTGATATQLVETACHLAFNIRDQGEPATFAARLAAGRTPPGKKAPAATRIDYLTARTTYLADLCVVLAAMVDIDASPTSLLAWALPDTPAAQVETIRMLGVSHQAAVEAARERRLSVPAESFDTLPAMTLQSMRALAKAADTLGVPHPCGTPGAHERHVLLREHPCTRCMKAMDIYRAANADEDRGVTKRGRTLKPCGTRAAYRRHTMKGEIPCEPCSAAFTASRREEYEQRLKAEGRNPTRRRAPSASRGTSVVAGTRKKQQRDPSKLKPCGTNAAYERHRRRHEQPCRPCMDAHTAYTAGYAAEHLIAAVQILESTLSPSTDGQAGPKALGGARVAA